MLSPAEWLARIGFTEGNPFALKWAENEGDRLPEYFIEHYAYHTVVDAGTPRSCVIHAPRGAGKSSTRQMFEAYCHAHADRLSPVLMRLIDWMPIVERAGAPAAVGPRDLLHELLRLFLVALVELPRGTAPTMPLPPDEAGYLRWLGHTCADYLSPAQRATLEDRGWLEPSGAPAAQTEPYSLATLPVLRSFQVLARITAALGCSTCYVVVDGVDELSTTTADGSAGASLLAPLLSNVRLLEVPGLAFKCFVPTEVITVLRERRLLREDRLTTVQLTWSRPLLHELLRRRLMAFSDGRIQSLAMAAAPELADIDEQLCASAAGSPRRLLNLGERLVQACAREADDRSLLLRAAHLRAALATEPDPAQADGQIPAVHRVPDAVPPLRLDPDGSVWRGEQLVDEARRLTPLQRRLLEYLYSHKGRLCATDELIEYVWAGRERPNDKDSLRRLADRLGEQIELAPHQPVYLERPYGGFYVLRHTCE